MKVLLEVLRQPLVIGAFVLSVLIVAGAYFGSHWAYRDIPGDTIQNLPLYEAGGVTSPPTVRAAPVIPQTVEWADSPEIDSESDNSVDSLEFDSETAIVFDASDAQAAPAEPERVSPFGFGPYPEVPLDYPRQGVWDLVEREGARDPEMAKNLELMSRVRIKLWNDGKPTLGASIDASGLVYPTYPNTVYVEWAEVVWEDGTVERYASRTKGDSVSSEDYENYFLEGLIPPGITVIPLSEGGIDPYQFLNLP